METDNTELVLQFVSAAQPELAGFAKSSFQDGGRGVIRVEFPEVPPGSTVVASTEMVYQTLEEIRRVVSSLKGDNRADAQILLGMIESYDPATQAVVTAVVGGNNPVSIKMKLAPPTLVAAPRGVH